MPPTSSPPQLRHRGDLGLRLGLGITAPIDLDPSSRDRAGGGELPQGYAPLNVDGIYFQSFTELHQEASMAG